MGVCTHWLWETHPSLSLWLSSASLIKGWNPLVVLFVGHVKYSFSLALCRMTGYEGKSLHSSVGMRRKPGKSVQNVTHAPQRTHTLHHSGGGHFTETSLGEILIQLKSNAKHTILNKLRTSAFFWRNGTFLIKLPQRKLGCSFKECQVP